MAAKWTTITFIQGFFSGTLGRKKVHGTYRVLIGDHCKLLVRATTSSGAPAGSELIAIDLSDENNKLRFWKQGYIHNCLTYSMSKNIEDGIGVFQSLPESMLTGEEEAIINSGIIDVDASRILIEIGDKPFLLHREVSSGDNPTVLLPTLSSGVPVYTYANQVPTRVSTIAEATEQVKDPVGERRLVGEWWAKQMDEGFVPPPFEQEHIKILSVPLNPLDYGFTMDECNVGSMSLSTTNIRGFVPKKKTIDTSTPSVYRWKDAVDAWTNAANAFLGRSPQVYSGLTVAISRYAHSASEDKMGEIIVTTQGVFITGIIHSNKDWNKSDTLNRWYKLTTEANQINIPKRE